MKKEETSTIIHGDYVLTPCKNVFNSKTSYWISKKGYTIAVYAFTPTSKSDLKHMMSEHVLDSYIRYYEDVLSRMKDVKANRKEEEIQRHIGYGGNKDIITFIFDFLYHSGPDNVEAVRNLYANGYCYYFAKMLEDAFPGGKICVSWPFGHIVYIYDSVAYDIDGITSAEYELFIPIDFIGSAVNDFRRVKGKCHGTTQEELDDIGKRWEALGTPIKVHSL